ncbi:MAG: DUF2182 domain-containing protein [Rhodospirillales bacterium]
MAERLEHRWFAADPISLSWVSFYGIILAAWTGLFAMTSAAALPFGTSGSLPTLLLEICRAGADPLTAGWSALFFMWALMALGMMAPTAVPLLSAWRDIERARPDRTTTGGFWLVLGGYLAVWLAFAGAAALAQRTIADAGWMSASDRLASPWAVAALLVVAGSYQFSRLKDACVSRCRSPMAYLTAHWRPGAGAAFAIGLRNGAACLGCCWALMLLGFGAGTMNLIWMGLATVLMITEKLPDVGRLVTRPLGVGLLIAAAGVALQSI